MSDYGHDDAMRDLPLVHPSHWLRGDPKDCVAAHDRLAAYIEATEARAEQAEARIEAALAVLYAMPYSAEWEKAAAILRGGTP